MRVALIGIGAMGEPMALNLLQKGFELSVLQHRRKEAAARLRALPGFGEQKARIFVALLGKQLGVQPEGWREVAGAYGEDGSRRSAADVTDPETLAEVRAFKQAAKKAARGG